MVVIADQQAAAAAAAPTAAESTPCESKTSSWYPLDPGSWIYLQILRRESKALPALSLKHAPEKCSCSWHACCALARVVGRAGRSTWAAATEAAGKSVAWLGCRLFTIAQHA